MDAAPVPSHRPANPLARLLRKVNKALGRIPPARTTLALPRTLRFLVHSLLPRSGSESGPPRPGLGPGLLASVAMDEAILATAMGPKWFPRREDYERVSRELREAYDVFGDRGWLKRPAAYHRAPPPLIDPLVIPSRTLTNVRFEKVVFESQFEPHAEEPAGARWNSYYPNRIAHAWLLRHHDDEPRPWLVCVHGFGMGFATADLTAFRGVHLHKELGFNLVLPVLPLHGPRKITPLGGEAFISFDLLNGVIGMAHAVWDIRRLLSWIHTQDPISVGAFGVSLGAYTSALVAGLAPELDYVMCGIPVSDLLALYKTHAPRILWRRAEEYGVFGDRARQVLAVSNPLTFPSRIPRSNRFIFAGVGDRLAQPQQAYDLWEHWSRPRIQWYRGNHVGYMWSSDVRRFVTEVLRSQAEQRPPPRAERVA